MSAPATSTFFAAASSVALTGSDMINATGNVVRITNNAGTVLIFYGPTDAHPFPQIQSLMSNNTNDVLRGPSSATTDLNVRVNDGNVAPPAGATNKDVSIAVPSDPITPPVHIVIHPLEPSPFIPEVASDINADPGQQSTARSQTLPMHHAGILRSPPPNDVDQEPSFTIDDPTAEAGARGNAKGPLASPTLAESVPLKKSPVLVRWYRRAAAHIGKMRRKMKSSRARSRSNGRNADVDVQDV